MIPKTSPATAIPWSPKKRLSISIVLSFGILLIAVIFGSSFYYLSLHNGLIKQQSLKANVLDKAMKDEELAKIFQDRIDKIDCINSDLGISLYYSHQFTPAPSTPSPCTLFTIKNSTGSKSVITFSQWHISPDKALNLILTSLTNISTDSWQSASHQGTLIKGLRNDQEYLSLIIATTTRSTWVIDIYPSDPLVDAQFKDFAQSFQFAP
jgi:hypothetical protein